MSVKENAKKALPSATRGTLRLFLRCFIMTCLLISQCYLVFLLTIYVPRTICVCIYVLRKCCLLPLFSLQFFSDAKKISSDVVRNKPKQIIYGRSFGSKT